MAARKTLYDFILESNDIHKNKYNYDKVDYINVKTKVCIICPIHGEFLQAPGNHLNGQGCPKCKRKSLDLFILQANEIHNNFYDYTETIYLSSKKKLR